MNQAPLESLCVPMHLWSSDDLLAHVRTLHNTRVVKQDEPEEVEVDCFAEFRI